MWYVSFRHNEKKNFILQVLALALFYAIVIRKPDTDEDLNKNPNLKKDEEFLHKQYKEKDINDPEALKAIQQYRTVVPVPPDEEFLREAREERFVNFINLDAEQICFKF